MPVLLEDSESGTDIPICLGRKRTVKLAREGEVLTEPLGPLNAQRSGGSAGASPSHFVHAFPLTDH